MKSFKQQCVELRLKDKTLNEIVQLTGRSKSTVYSHIKNILLSEQKQWEIKNKTREQALLNAAARKGVGLRPYKEFTGWTPETVLLISHLMFDGEIMKGRCVYNNRSQALLKRVECLMKIVYSFPPKRHLDMVSGVHKLQYNNVALASFLNKKACELQVYIIHKPIVLQKEFLRAFFDDEGCMDFRSVRNVRQIRGYQNNQYVLHLVRNLLANLNIVANLKGKNEVVISRKENLKKFQKEINFSSGVCLNPNRTNSIWKQSIEKRVLLDRAIKSFKT